MQDGVCDRLKESSVSVRYMCAYDIQAVNSSCFYWQTNKTKNPVNSDFSIFKLIFFPW